MQAAGVDCSRVIRDPSAQTALAVLPIFKSGERGCFVNLAANDDLLGDEVAAALREVSEMDGPPVAAFHYGYPHFTKQVRVLHVLAWSPTGVHRVQHSSLKNVWSPSQPIVRRP